MKYIPGITVLALSLFILSCRRETCADGIKNQDELNVDCGGICKPCFYEHCTDKVMNGDETGIDCGGRCEPCPTCNDGILNQNERYTDCGGICEPCDYVCRPIPGNMDLMPLAVGNLWIYKGRSLGFNVRNPHLKVVDKVILAGAEYFKLLWLEEGITPKDSMLLRYEGKDLMRFDPVNNVESTLMKAYPAVPSGWNTMPPTIGLSTSTGEYPKPVISISTQSCNYTKVLVAEGIARYQEARIQYFYKPGIGIVVYRECELYSPNFLSNMGLVSATLYN